MQKFDITIFCADGFRIDTEITCFEDIRAIVDGNVELIPVKNSSLVIACNDQGFKKLPQNATFPTLAGTIALIDQDSVNAMPYADNLQ